MRYVYLSIIFTLFVSSIALPDPAFREITIEEVQDAFNQPLKPHPRLFITDRQLTEIQDRIKSDTALAAFYKAILDKADGILDQPPVKRIKTGRRLLSVSRQCLDRVIHLSAAYRFTKNQSYLDRAQKELLAAAAFSDWNPSHFLDVAEMTTALAIGYDWLYNDLPEKTRQTIAQAIMQKGIEPSFKNTGWVRGGNNWNQVCNGGITLGALAVMEDHPKLAQQIVHRAVNGIQVVMKHYEPDGAYPEGPGYWVYGTSYNVVLFAALDSVLGTDFNLSKAPGFARSAEYFLHVAGPTGNYFNYPDSGSKGGFTPAVFWFVQKYDQPSLAWYQHQLWKDASAKDASQLVQSRLAPLTLAWSKTTTAVPDALCWTGRGSNSVAMFRNSWTDPDTVYMAIKGGSPGVSHGHMDVGTFVIDADGLRWAADLGPESYNKIETLGMNLWGGSQNAERWKIFRYNNLSHSTLVVNDQHQIVTGNAPIIRFSDDKSFPHVVFDMSELYKGQLAQALRGASLLPSGQIIIKDEFEAAEKSASVRWAMVTPAEVTIESDNTALLKQKGKTMRLTVLTDQKVQLKTWSTEPKADYDAPNPGKKLIGFELSLPPAQSAATTVIMTPPGTKEITTINLKPLSKWSKP